MQLQWLAPLMALTSFALAAEETTKPKKPCTIKSPMTGLEFDLSGLAVLPLAEGEHSSKTEKRETWTARGWDYNVNFTINVCAPVVEPLEDVVGVKESLWQNTSAYYKQNGEIYSLGQQNSDLMFRGRKLVLNYTNGSPCDTKFTGEDNEKRRKSMIISFLCAEDTYESSKPKVQFSFVGSSPDYCHYNFEARTALACGGVVAPTEQAVGPGSLFGIIAFIALAVYIFGGVAYQRNVMHQRGWRQIPNYSLWAGVASFFGDMFIILFSSCTRCLPGRRGYNRLSNQNGRARGSSREDENRLIDQLDEEWED